MNAIIESADKAQQQLEIQKETDKLVKAYTSADLEQQKTISVHLRKDLFTSDSPRNAEELYRYMQVVYGLSVGTTVSDDRWTPPFEWVYATYFDKYPTLLAIASRGSGKTLSASALTYDKCAHRKDYAAVHVGARLDQADVAQIYLDNFSQDPALNIGLDRKGIGKKRAAWDSTSSTWKIVSGTTAGISGQHPQMLTIDEIEFADAVMIEQSWAVPIPKNGWPRLWSGFSTRQKACLPAHTRIITEDGPKKIRDIVNQKYSGKVKSYNFETKEWEWNTVTDWFKNGKTDCWWHLHLEFPSMGKGSSLTCTKNHELLRPDGRKTPLQELKPGDLVCIEDHYIDPIQEEILLGTFMGDSYVTPDGGCKVVHSDKQLNYLEWMHQALKSISGDIVMDKKGYWGFGVKTTLLFQRVRRDYYTTDHGKHIPDWIWSRLTTLSIAIWLMDDGCYTKSIRKNGSWRIAACHFTDHEKTKCSEFFENLGIPGYWYQFIKGNESTWSFNFTVENSRKLTELVKDYLTIETHKGEGLGYKTWIADSVISPPYSTVLAPIAVKEVVSAKLEEGTMYDITVDKVHNYQVYSGVLVGNSNVMNQLVQDAENGKRKIKVMQWSVFEAMEPCRTCVAEDEEPYGNEEARNKVCPLWSVCQGVKARKVSGWMSRQQVIDTMSTMNEESIQTQLFCLRPSTHGVVLHNFRHEHANAGNRNKGNYFDWKFQPDLPFFVWHDPAETKKACALFVQAFGGALFAFDEVVDESGPTGETMKTLVHKKCLENGYGEPKKVVIDWKRPDSRKTWLAGTLDGIGKDHCFNAVHANVKGGLDDIEAGLDLVRTYILNGVGTRKFFINPQTCPKHADAVMNNLYKVDKNNEIHSNTKQAEKFKDEIDTIRNGIIDYHRSGAGASV